MTRFEPGVFLLLIQLLLSVSGNAVFAAGKYFETEPGVELYYEDSGSGAPIVFVPGWTFTTEVFIHQQRHFSQSNRVIVLDPRSQGRSSISLHGNDYVTHGADLARLIKHLALKDFVLVGWSNGCLETWAYIRAEGLDKLRAHACIDLSPKPLATETDVWVEGPLDDIAVAYHTYLRDAKGQRQFVAWYTQEVMVERELDAQELDWAVAQSLRSPPFVAAALFASGLFSDYRAEAKLLDKSRPSLFVIAKHWADSAVPYIQQNFPATQTVVLGGHMMFWEHPQAFNQALENFLVPEQQP